MNPIVKEFLIAKLKSDLAIEQSRYKVRFYPMCGFSKEYPEWSSNVIKEIESQLKNLQGNGNM